MWKDKYREWSENEQLAGNLKNELKQLTNEKEIEDRFYRYLEFGTGGMRGELGVGTNRINQYTIQRVALGLARYIEQQGVKAKQAGVVIAYDNRFFSKEFAQWTASVLASCGIKCYLSDAMKPTPELSFLVREWQAFAGVMITASHNPKEYNGFKVYGSDGGQITLETAQELLAILKSITNELTIEIQSLAEYCSKKQIVFFGKEADQLYLKQLLSVTQQPQMIQEHGEQLRIAYTPLHGTGEVLIKQGFAQIGFNNFSILKEQADGDPAFSTVSIPNPEDSAAFQLILTAEKEQLTDLFLATDPDADRLGVIIMNENQQPVLLNGNQIGVLLLDYLIQQKRVQGKKLTDYFLAKTIVTSDLGKRIAEHFGIETHETLTGFKFIGEEIKQAEQSNDKQFLFGYEESFGYLIQPFVRDKDAIQAAVLMAELTLNYKLAGKSVYTRLMEIYQEYGFYQEALETIEFRGKSGQIKMARLLEEIRGAALKQVGTNKIAYQEDYLSAERLVIKTGQSERILLPKSNVIKFIFESGDWLCIRPSGTEPKCKIYFSVHEQNEFAAEEKLKTLQNDFRQLLDQLIKE